MSNKDSKSLHEKRKSMVAPLSSDLREDHGFRSLSVREGDEVEVKTGDYAGMEGEVTNIDTDSQRIEIEGIEAAKADETEVSIPIHPSNVEITNIEKDDMRDKIIERRSESGEKRQEETSEETERTEDTESA